MACGRHPSPPYTFFDRRLGPGVVNGMELDGEFLGQMRPL
jgi:hypothetical protein